MARPSSGAPPRAKVDTYLDAKDLSLFHQLMDEDSRNKSDMLRALIRSEAKRRNITPKKVASHGRRTAQKAAR